MFAGITQATGAIAEAGEHGRCRVVSIRTPKGWKLSMGQSVLVDGICSTVMRQKGGSFYVEYMPETLSKTTAGAFAAGRAVNLERSLKLQDMIDGHLVTGHVDAKARVVSVKRTGSSQLITVELPKNLRRYVLARGSIALNGVSLTVARKYGRTITVALVPYTRAHTNLGVLTKGDEVNVETDMLVRALVAGGRK